MPEVEEHEHEHKSSGIAKAGLVTGIIGTTMSVINAAANGTNIFGGGNNNYQQDEINRLRNENVLLLAEKSANEKIHALEITVAKQGEQINAMRTEFGQAINYETSLRIQAENGLRQYIDDNFIKAKKCVDAQTITPPVSVWPFNTPSFAQPVYAPIPPFSPVPAPAQTTTQNGTSGGTTQQG